MLSRDSWVSWPIGLFLYKSGVQQARKGMSEADRVPAWWAAHAHNETRALTEERNLSSWSAHDGVAVVVVTLAASFK